MTRLLFRVFGGTALALVLFLFTAAPLWAETITFPGAALDSIETPWNVGGGGIANSLAPSGSADGKSNSISGNSVTVGAGVVAGTVSNVYGALNYLDSNAVTSNKVFIYGAVDLVFGGAAANNGGATASSNSVNISGGTISSGGSVRGGYATSTTGTATASDNNVSINSSTVNNEVAGGLVQTTSGGSAIASGNNVTISGSNMLTGATSWIYGGEAYSNTGTGTATASNNTVNISGSTVQMNTIGGRAQSAGGTATANNNNVIINGGNMAAIDIIGGRANSTTGVARATNNTVTIMGNPTFGAGIDLYGGSGSGAAGSDFRSGNTLNLHSPVTVRDLQNFENWNFYLPSTMGNGGTMLTVTGTAALGTSANVHVGVAGGNSPLQEGDTVKLIDAGTLTGTLGNNTTHGQGMHGVTLGYEFDIDIVGNQLIATVTEVGSLDSNEAFSEGMAGGAALVNVGADFAAGPGIAWAMGAAGQKGSGSGFGGFGGIQGGKSRYKTGSHVDMSSVSLLAGLAWGNDFNPGRMTLGVFFEYGNGSYDTYNSFANTGSIKGKGDMYNVGGGLLGRFDANCGGYVESSFRAGSLHNEYKNNDLWGAKYTSNSTYYGFHLGAGYIWNINEKASLDLHGKYFWTRVEGDSVTLSTGDPIKFKDVDSSRLRFGGRFAYAVNEYVSPYVGAAYEHEFDGKARATTNGYDIKAPSLRGNTGIGELGLSLTPSMNLPLSIDLGVQGYTGKREGVTGSLQMRWEF